VHMVCVIRVLTSLSNKSRRVASLGPYQPGAELRK
jgi:hypothetical protein